MVVSACLLGVTIYWVFVNYKPPFGLTVGLSKGLCFPCDKRFSVVYLLAMSDDRRSSALVHSPTACALRDTMLCHLKSFASSHHRRGEFSFIQFCSFLAG
jgi:hypothetical protein